MSDILLQRQGNVFVNLSRVVLRDPGPDPDPDYRLSSFARWAFSVAGPSVWNSLAEYLRDPTVGKNSFRKQLKTFLFATY